MVCSMRRCRDLYWISEPHLRVARSVANRCSIPGRGSGNRAGGSCRRVFSRSTFDIPLPKQQTTYTRPETRLPCACVRGSALSRRPGLQVQGPSEHARDSRANRAGRPGLVLLHRKGNATYACGQPCTPTPTHRVGVEGRIRRRSGRARHQQPERNRPEYGRRVVHLWYPGSHGRAGRRLDPQVVCRAACDDPNR